MKEQVFHALLGLLEVHIEPVTQVGSAQKGFEQSDIAVVCGIGTPGKEGIATGREGGNEEEAAKIAAGEGDESGDEDRNGSGNDDDAPPLLKEATASKWALDQDPMAHNRVPHKQDDQGHGSRRKNIQEHQICRNMQEKMRKKRPGRGLASLETPPLDHRPDA